MNFPSLLLLSTCLLGTLLPSPCAADRSSAGSTRPEDVEHQQHFAHLWEQRFTRDVSTEVLPFLDDPDLELRERAVRALGRLEKPGVLAELQKRRDAQEAAIQADRINPSKDPIHYLDYHTPIARIQSRDLHGREKIEFVITHLGGPWSWDEAVQLSKTMKEPFAHVNTMRSKWFQQTLRLWEIVDMLYSMSKKGENIEELRRPFLFSKPQNDQLDGAKMTPEQEAEHLLDCSEQVDIVGHNEDYVYESHLLSLGEPARMAIKKRLEQVLHDKPKFTHKFPITCMLRAAARTGDKSFLPLFDRFQKEMTYIEYAINDASHASEGLRVGLAYPYAPQ